MYIQNQNQTPFQSLYKTYGLRNILKTGASKEFKSELGSIERGIRKKNLHKKENVDVLLSYSKEDGFYGVISSKEQGTPMNPGAVCKVKNDKASMNNFAQWVNVWNEAYSPEELKKFRDLLNFIRK